MWPTWRIIVVSKDRNWGASGFSVRRGGERASEDDDVEGHAMTTSQREMGASAMNRPGQRASDDDVEGHGLSRPGQKAADDEDVEGHGLSRPGSR